MKRWTPLLTVMLLLGVCALAEGCPFCKDAIPSSDAQTAGGVPSGFNNSIFLMLGGMFAVLGFVVFTLARAARTTMPPTSSHRGFPLS
jgi:hypothetical protein